MFTHVLWLITDVVQNVGIRNQQSLLAPLHVVTLHACHVCVRVRVRVSLIDHQNDQHHNFTLNVLHHTCIVKGR